MSQFTTSYNFTIYIVLFFFFFATFWLLFLFFFNVDRYQFPLFLGICTDKQNKNIEVDKQTDRHFHLCETIPKQKWIWIIIGFHFSLTFSCSLAISIQFNWIYLVFCEFFIKYGRKRKIHVHYYLTDQRIICYRL